MVIAGGREPAFFEPVHSLPSGPAFLTASSQGAAPQPDDLESKHVQSTTVHRHTVVTPSGRSRPSVLGMYTLRTGFARYAPRFSLAERSWRLTSSASP